MRSIFPVDELRTRLGLPLRIEEYTLADLPALCELKQEAMFGLAMSVWNRLVHARVKRVNPQALGPWVRRTDPMTFKEIERLIGEPAFHDVFYLRAILPMEFAPGKAPHESPRHAVAQFKRMRITTISA